MSDEWTILLIRKSLMNCSPLNNAECVPFSTSFRWSWADLPRKLENHRLFSPRAETRCQGCFLVLAFVCFSQSWEPSQCYRVQKFYWEFHCSLCAGELSRCGDHHVEDHGCLHLVRTAGKLVRCELARVGVIDSYVGSSQLVTAFYGTVACWLLNIHRSFIICTACLCDLGQYWPLPSSGVVICFLLLNHLIRALYKHTLTLWLTSSQ